MSKSSEFFKEQAKKDIEFFYGETKQVSNKYFTFKRVKDDDNIVIVTSNIKVLKGNYVLIVASNKAVYLKDWQVKKAHSYDLGINTYVVKLNRKFFTPYTFSFEFEDYIGMEEYDFDGWKKVAEEQDVVNMKVANGWMQ